MIFAVICFIRAQIGANVAVNCREHLVSRKVQLLAKDHQVTPAEDGSRLDEQWGF